MISEEKMVHIIHLMLDGIWKADYVDFTDEEAAVREAKRAGIQYLQDLNTITDVVRKKILSQKNPPKEHTQQWENLYRKYFEEEFAKKGG